MKKIIFISGARPNLIKLAPLYSFIKKKKTFQIKILQTNQHSNKFMFADICKDLLPSCDILMVRDCLFHLSFDDINQTLKNISRVDYKFLITTSHMTDVDYVNSDIKSGDFRWLDISKWPLNFEPKYVFDRFSEPPQGGMNRDIIMYRKEHVPTEMMQK